MMTSETEKKIKEELILTELMLFSPEELKQKGDEMKELENGFIFNYNKEVIHIPCRNNRKEIIAWAITDLDEYENIKYDTYHVAGKRKGCLDLPYPANSNNIKLHKQIFKQEVPEGHQIDHYNGHTFDARKKNFKINSRNLFWLILIYLKN